MNANIEVKYECRAKVPKTKKSQRLCIDDLDEKLRNEILESAPEDATQIHIRKVFFLERNTMNRFEEVYQIEAVSETKAVKLMTRHHSKGVVLTDTDEFCVGTITENYQPGIKVTYIVANRWM